jgi:hypothetical protein
MRLNSLPFVDENIHFTLFLFILVNFVITGLLHQHSVVASTQSGGINTEWWHQHRVVSSTPSGGINTGW